MTDDAGNLGPAMRRWIEERRPQLEVARGLCDRATAGSVEADHLLGAYVVRLVSEFQGFCADLLSDLVDLLVESLPPGSSRPVLLRVRTALTADRLIDTRNPTTANLSRDFIRFGLTLRGGLVKPAQLKPLEAAVAARNKLAHAGGGLLGLGADGGHLSLDLVRRWEQDLDDLAATLDASVRKHMS